MENTTWYILLAIAAVVLFGPAVFANRSPIPETSGNVYKVRSLSELNALLSSTTHVVVDFYADWCPPCRTIAPVYSKLADDHAAAGRLAFAKVNVDHAAEVGRRYGITAMPSFLFFEGGKNNGVAVQGVKPSASVKTNEEGRVERILGANVAALRSVVQVLAGKA